MKVCLSEIMIETGYDNDPEISYLEQPELEKEKQDYYDGFITFYYCRAIINLEIPIRNNLKINQRIESPGLYSIAMYVNQDIEEDGYIKEVYEEERDILISMLDSMGIEVIHD